MSSVVQKKKIARTRPSTDTTNIQEAVERFMEEYLNKKDISVQQKDETVETSTVKNNQDTQAEGTTSEIVELKTKKKQYVWFSVLLISVIVSCQYIQNSYKKWQASPVLLSFNDSLTSISSVPFPAVTICPGRQLAEEYTSDVELAATECTSKDACSNEQWHLLSAGGLLCPKSQRLKRESEDNYLEGTIDKIVKGLSSTCAEDTTWFKLNGDEYSYNCSSRFQTLFLDGTVCFTFNMLPARELFHNHVYVGQDSTELKEKLAEYIETD